MIQMFSMKKKTGYIYNFVSFIYASYTYRINKDFRKMRPAVSSEIYPRFLREFMQEFPKNPSMGSIGIFPDIVGIFMRSSQKKLSSISVRIPQGYSWESLSFVQKFLENSSMNYSAIPPGVPQEFL